MMDIHDQLRETEIRRLRALVDGNFAIARELHADDYLLVNPSGKAITKAEYLGSIANGELKYLMFEPESEIDVRVHGDMAALRYISRIQVVLHGETSPVMRIWHIDMYENRQGTWQDVWSQATLIVE